MVPILKKTGHKTDDCWWKQEPEHTGSSNNDCSAMNQPSKENKRLTCFACGESGHIKPNCPNQQQMSMADKRPIQKKDGLKVRQLSIHDSDHHLIKTEGLMNGMKTTIILDPAADISLVLKEYVNKEKWDGRRANVVVVQYPTVKRDIAIVDFEVQGCTLRKRVALVPRSELNSGTIFSIDFTKADQRELMIKVAEDMEEKEEKVVCKVETRSQARKREEEEEQEAEQELQDNPTTHNLDDHLVQLSENVFDENNSSEVDEAGNKHDRANSVLEGEDEYICLGKGSACCVY